MLVLLSVRRVRHNVNKQARRGTVVRNGTYHNTCTLSFQQGPATPSSLHWQVFGWGVALASKRWLVVVSQVRLPTFVNLIDSPMNSPLLLQCLSLPIGPNSNSAIQGNKEFSSVYVICVSQFFAGQCNIVSWLWLLQSTKLSRKGLTLLLHTKINRPHTSVFFNMLDTVNCDQ